MAVEDRHGVDVLVSRILGRTWRRILWGALSQMQGLGFWVFGFWVLGFGFWGSGFRV